MSDRTDQAAVPTATASTNTECTEEEKPTPEREGTSTLVRGPPPALTETVPKRPPVRYVTQAPSAAAPAGNRSPPQASAIENSRRIMAVLAAHAQPQARTPIQAARPSRERSPEAVQPRPRPLSISPIKAVTRKRAAADQMKTLIFMDFETTGLFPGRNSCPFNLKTSSDPRDFASELEKFIINTQRHDYPKITEMSFIAVPRDVFVRGVRNMENYIPRVDATASIRVRVPCNVHTRQVKPPLNAEEWRIYEAHRAKEHAIVHSQEDLSSKNTFGTEWQQVRAFLDSCPKPACFVAHNGIAFDYRVLYGELNASGMLAKAETTVPDGIYFVDSLLAFNKIQDQQKQTISAVLSAIDWNSILSSIQRCPANMNDHNYAAGNVSPDHPLNFLNTDGWSPAKLRRWTPEYFRKTAAGQWEVCNRNGFKLPDLFRDIIKDKADFHFAQDDSDALLQICLAYGEEFIDYLDTCAAEIPF